MSRRRVQAYLICGGLYHDMDFARLELLKLLAEDDSFRVRVGEDYSDAAAIAQADLLITYTCNVLPTEAGENALREFLGAGKRWLALHGTNSVLKYLKGKGWDAPRDRLGFMQMLGSQFVAHPPIQPYQVVVSDPQHPLVAGIETFTVDDELYLSEYHGETHALLHATFAGEAPGFTVCTWPANSGVAGSERHLVLYLHPHAGGEVLYFTLGHCRGKYDMRPMIDEYSPVERGSWKLPVYHELLRRGIRWAAAPVH